MRRRRRRCCGEGEEEEDWAYGGLPSGEIEIEVLEAATHRRLCALVESKLEVFSVLEDAWSHMVARVACASSEESEVWARFIASETWLYAKRLEASRARTPLVEGAAQWLCASRPEALARAVGARRVDDDRLGVGVRAWFCEEEPVFSMPLHGRRTRAAGSVWADCGPAVAARHDVVLAGGHAFFATAGLVEVAVARFRRRLRGDLGLARRALEQKGGVPLEPRIKRLVSATRAALAASIVPPMSRAHRSPTLKVIEDVRSFDLVMFPGRLPAKRSRFRQEFARRAPATRLPPCAAQMHRGLRQTHHLKHHARFQYATFLKTIGITYAQALELWRAEFILAPHLCSKPWVAYEKQLRTLFERDPAGTLAHTCESGMADKSPRPNRATGEFHGCPFVFDSKTDLEDLLEHMGVPQPARVLADDDEEEDGASRVPYSLRCCSRAFRALHPKTPVAPPAARSKPRPSCQGGSVVFRRPCDWVYRSFATVPLVSPAVGGMGSRAKRPYSSSSSSAAAL
ncbi:hypothetical protein CTAYLR_002763 [Chrysophaeum taylorii]|uniref:DNA primase large subunit C-terminal domain-containing protein n=1 Tax=Chrysophaeum taylorii TaxID=2483200 RepID=A0AAD7XN68_9STRA|nr:hypothetical protein CTAYLR_002763 [Chrysophaeum taylorii]